MPVGFKEQYLAAASIAPESPLLGIGVVKERQLISDSIYRQAIDLRQGYPKEWLKQLGRSRYDDGPAGVPLMFPALGAIAEITRHVQAEDGRNFTPIRLKLIELGDDSPFFNYQLNPVGFSEDLGLNSVTTSQLLVVRNTFRQEPMCHLDPERIKFYQDLHKPS